MKHKHLNQKGFSAGIAIAAIAVLLVVGFCVWYVWDKQKQTGTNQPKGSQAAQNSGNETQAPAQNDDTGKWVLVTTQGKAFNMRVPDGWEMVNYPDDFLGSTAVVYKPGTPAVIENSANSYAGHSLRFRASVAEIDDAGLGPQWASPQPGLEESTQDFSVGSLHGKRYKGIFSGDLNQTLYEYVFDLGGNKKLDIVYAIYHSEGEKDDHATVEKAIKTIQFGS
jgi:hypothetical protein